MGKCFLCGSKIQYNQFEKIDGKVYCPVCATKLKNKLKELVTPPGLVEEIIKDVGISILGEKND